MMELKKYSKTWNDSYLGRSTSRRGFRNAKELEKRSYNEGDTEEKWKMEMVEISSTVWRKRRDENG